MNILAQLENNDLTTLSELELIKTAFNTSQTRAKKLHQALNGNLYNLEDSNLQELTAWGLNDKEANQFLALMELNNRIAKSRANREQVLSSQRMARKVMAEIGKERQEQLRAYYLDAQNRIVDERMVFKGTVSRSIAESREILHHAVKNLATSVIVAHNHPSGTKTPSSHDDEFTKNLAKSCNLLGIILLDHLIVTRDDYYSFREETDLLV